VERELSKQSDPLSLATVVVLCSVWVCPGKLPFCAKIDQKKQQEVCLGSAKSVCFDNAESPARPRARRVDPAQIISTMHDVTELKRADAALRKSEAVNRSIIEAST
jgi:hypothetical protein